MCGNELLTKALDALESDRQHAHDLIDRLPDIQIPALIGLLETIVDPAAAALRNAELDDEPETGEDKASPAA